MKHCPKCDLDKEDHEFYETSAYCKPCCAEYARERREELKATQPERPSRAQIRREVIYKLVSLRTAIYQDAEDHVIRAEEHDMTIAEIIDAILEL